MVKNISKANMYNMANDIVSYVSKNYSLPSKLTYDGTTFYILEYAYIVSYGLYHLKSGFQIPNFEWAKNPTGDKVNENIKQDEYKDMAKRVYNYIIKNKQVPNYTSTKSGKKVDIRLYIWAISKCLKFYSEKGHLPANVQIDYNAFIKPVPKTQTISLNPYITSQGCNGMGQCTGYYCACNSLQQCFYRLTGIKVSESTIASVAGTTTAGTGHAGIETAVAWFNRKYGKNIKITWKNFSDIGWSELKDYMNKGAVFCHLLYRDQWGHYEVPKQITDDNVIVLNSLGDSCGSGTYCGYIETRSKSTHRRYLSGISQKSIAILTI